MADDAATAAAINADNKDEVKQPVVSTAQRVIYCPRMCYQRRNLVVPSVSDIQTRPCVFFNNVCLRMWPTTGVL